MNINYGGSLNGLLLHLPACHKPLSQKRQKSWVLLYWSPVNYFSKGCQRVKWGTLSDVSCQRSYFSDLTGLWWVCVCGSSVWVAVLEQRLMVKGCLCLTWKCQRWPFERRKPTRSFWAFFPVSAFWYTQAPQKSCVSKGKLHFIISIYCPFLLLVCLIRCIRVFLKNECNSKKKKSDMGPEVFFVDNHYKVNYWTCWSISFCTSAVGITAIFALTACTLAYTMCTGFLTLCRKGSPLTWISL